VVFSGPQATLVLVLVRLRVVLVVLAPLRVVLVVLEPLRLLARLSLARLARLSMACLSFLGGRVVVLVCLRVLPVRLRVLQAPLRLLQAPRPSRCCRKHASRRP
jgi:hypothetical protein